MRLVWGLALISAAVGACDPIPSEPVIGDPTVAGSITTIEASQDRFRILVEEDPTVFEPLEPGGAKIWFTISDQTAIFDTRGPTVRRGARSDLTTGLWVEAVAHGILLDSYPQQALADTIVIVS